MVLIRLVNMCMQFGLDHSDVDKIEQSFVHWVEVFERQVFAVCVSSDFIILT